MHDMMMKLMAVAPISAVVQAPGSAQDSPKDTATVPTATEQFQRLVWEQAGGLCRYIDKGNDDWVETDKAGRVAFRFKEAKRNCDFVDLLDKSRGFTIRLYKNAMYMKGGADGLQQFGDFTKYYDGRWVK